MNDEERVSIKAYIDTRFAAVDRAADARFAALQTAIETLERSHRSTMEAMDKAVLKAEHAADRRFESVNEFRKTLSDQTQSFLTRNEFNVEHRALLQRMDSFDREVRSRLDTSGGAGKGMSSLWSLITTTIIAVGAAATALAILLHIRQ